MVDIISHISEKNGSKVRERERRQEVVILVCRCDRERGGERGERERGERGERERMKVKGIKGIKEQGGM